MSVHILGYTNGIILRMIVFGYNTLLELRLKLYLSKNVLWVHFLNAK